MADTESQPLLSTETDNNQTVLDHAKYERAVDNDVLLESSKLGRTIGWSGGYILIISRVIGSGIFAMPGAILQNVGSPGVALLLWVAGAVVAWTGLIISIEYGCMLPRSGGVKVYLEYTFRRPRFLASTLVAVHAVLLGFTASNCIVFAKYLLYATGSTPTDVSTKSLAVALLTAVTVVHSCFYKSGIWIQNVLGWVKIVLIVFTILTGLFVCIFRPGNSVAKDNWEHTWDDSNWQWNALATAFFKVFYSYAGLDNINNVLNEVKDPIRMLKYLGPTALLTACMMYLLINVAFLSVVPLEEIRQSRELISAIFFDRLGFGRSFLPVAIALSAAGNVMVVTFSLARLNQEIARQGFLPFAILLASNKPFNAPAGGLLVHFIPSVLVITIPSSATVYSLIADIEGYAGQFFGLAVGLGLIVLRYNKVDLHRPFKAWLPAVWLRIVLSIALILAPFLPPKSNQSSDSDSFYGLYAVVGISVFIFGLAYWLVWTVLLPQFRGYRLEEEVDVLPDGTTITKLVRKPRE